MLPLMKISQCLSQDFRLGQVSKVFLSFLSRKNYRSDTKKQQNCKDLLEMTHVFSLRNRNKMSDTTTTIIENNIFNGKDDRYKGVIVSSNSESCSIEGFSKKLKDSLDAWRSSGKRAIWFKVYLDQSQWVPILVKNGFKYHHAKEEYAMLYLWLPEEPLNLPAYSHTMVGVGAVVINEKGQLLVIQEKYHITPKRMWKLPGGYVEPGENLVDAAIREVMEETNIRTEFESLLTIRHGHGAAFECSDLYFVVSLKAKSFDIVKCEREIAECEWMDVDEYLSHPHVHELNRFFVHKHMEHQKHNHKIECRHGIHQVLKKPYTVYSVVKKEDPSEDNETLEFQWEENKNHKL